MAYQALYRKYRSQTFGEMVGQEVVATTLKNAIVNGTISHAYLFSGPRGTGKTSAARIFAKAINCLHPEDGEPDNVCEICEAINNGNLDDIIELDAASNNGVDEIREIIDKSAYAATRATYKVYIIDEVHMLTTSAFNALLKVLEEPTANVVFILATTELQKVPATIISRVQRFAFKAITQADIKQHLADVLIDEKVEYEEKALDVIARAAEGGMRDALSLLDQALSFADGKLTENEALLVTGAIADEALSAYVSAIAAYDAPQALAELQKIFDEGKNMLRFAEDLMGHFRDMLLAKDTEIPHEHLYQMIDVVIESMKVLRETTQTKIAADVMTMRLCEEQAAPARGDSVRSQTSPIAKQSRPEKMPEPVVETKATIMPQAEVQTKTATMPEAKNQPDKVLATNEKQAATQKNTMPAASVSSQDLLNILKNATREDKNAVTNAWEEVINSVKTVATPRNAALVGVLTPQASSPDAVILTVESDILAQNFNDNADLKEQVESYLAAITKQNYTTYAVSDEAWKKLRESFVANRKTSDITESVAEPSADAVPLPEEPQAVDAMDLPDNFQTAPERKEGDALATAQSLFGSLVTGVND
ncbi:MAG: DNA polymerase III subunit gamma/tau [Streptococcaceae bacterium]|jgi:DNA polymerase-3 subunit gamma/tau|nr:DNA polymerase III subunit gamma/tau [Streptococcaceae bacterium]